MKNVKVFGMYFKTVVKEVIPIFTFPRLPRGTIRTSLAFSSPNVDQMLFESYPLLQVVWQETRTSKQPRSGQAVHVEIRSVGLLSWSVSGHWPFPVPVGKSVSLSCALTSVQNLSCCPQRGVGLFSLAVTPYCTSNNGTQQALIDSWHLLNTYYMPGIKGSPLQA